MCIRWLINWSFFMIIYVARNDANEKYNFLNEINSKHFALFAHISRKSCIQKTIFFCSWLSLQFSLAEQTLNMSLRSFSSFIRVAVKHFTRSDGIKQLWSNNYEILQVCGCIIVLVIRQANRIFSLQHYPVISVLSGASIFSSLSYKRQNFREQIF